MRNSLFAAASLGALCLPNSGITPAKPDAMTRTVLEAQCKVLVF
jgi:hypothetical protein